MYMQTQEIDQERFSFADQCWASAQLFGERQDRFRKQPPLHRQWLLGELACRHTIGFGLLRLSSSADRNVLLIALPGQGVNAQMTDSHLAQKKFTTRSNVSLGVFGQVTPARMPTITTVVSIGTKIMQTTSHIPQEIQSRFQGSLRE